MDTGAFLEPSVDSIPHGERRHSSVLDRMRRGLSTIVFIIGLVLFLASGSFSQTIKGTYSFDRSGNLFADELYRRLKDDARPQDVLLYFFHQSNLYDDKIPVLLVFIDKKERADNPLAAARISLLKGGKRHDSLHGEKYVHVMVFVAESISETKSVSDPVMVKSNSETIKRTQKKCEAATEDHEWLTESKPRDVVLVHQSSIDYRQGSGEFFITSLVKTVASIVSGKSMEKADEVKKAEDIPDKPVRLQKVCGSDSVNVFFGYVRIPVYENTINRITVQEDYGGDKIYRHLATFGNYSASRVTSSIGIMGTFMKSGEATNHRTPIEAFIFGHFYLKRPELPAPRYQGNPAKVKLRQLSFSLVGGTKLSSKDLFDDLYVGVCLGHLLSTTGIVLGVSFRAPRDATGAIIDGKRKAHFCAGLTFIF